MAQHKVGQSTLIGFCLSVVAALSLANGVYVTNYVIRQAVIGVAVCLMMVALCYFHMSSLNPAATHSQTSQWRAYVTHYVNYVTAALSFMAITSKSSDVEKAQAEFMARIMRRNAHCEYGRKWGFGTVINMGTFKHTLPLTTYTDLSPLIEGVLKGKQNTTTTEMVEEVVCDSKNGKQRYFPTTLSFRDDLRHTKGLLDYFIDSERDFELSRSILVDNKPEIPHIDGLKTSCMENMSAYQSSSMIPRGADVTTPESRAYVHALLALSEPEVSSMEFSSPEALWKFVRTLKEEGGTLAEDLRRGKVNSKVELSDAARRAIQGILETERKRVTAVKDILEGGELGMAVRLWPGLQHFSIRWQAEKPEDTGAASDHVTDFFKGVAWMPSAHVIPGAVIGVPMKGGGCLGDRPFLFAFWRTVFEFIDIRDLEEGAPETFLLHQVVEGRRYEVVVTSSGLYRYRTGIVVMVTGSWNSGPLYVNTTAT